MDYLYGLSQATGKCISYTITGVKAAVGYTVATVSTVGSKVSNSEVKGTTIATGATSAVVGPMILTKGISAIGFTKTGIAAASVASGIQSWIGNVVAGSTFATLQSIGASGGFAIFGPVGIGAGILGAWYFPGLKQSKDLSDKFTGVKAAVGYTVATASTVGSKVSNSEVKSTTVASGATWAVVGPMILTKGISAIGFTTSGIAAGSIAAGIQSGIGNVVAGSTFATLQSIGATGGFAIFGPVGVGAGILVAWYFSGPKQPKDLSDSDDTIALKIETPSQLSCSENSKNHGSSK